MALTPKEQSKIIQLLGYGGKTIQVGSVIYNKILNDRLNQLTPDMEEILRAFLASITSLECRIAAAPGRLAAAQVDGIKMNMDELPQLRIERRKISKEIAEYLDIPFIKPGGTNVSVMS